YLPAMDVPAKSAIGAGDSFIAGMLFRLAEGDSAREAFRYGMAAGSAAMLTVGTELAKPADIERLLAEDPAYPGGYPIPSPRRKPGSPQVRVPTGGTRSRLSPG